MYGFSVGGLIGVCLGFMLGVGCALAVMYSIYLGGYRAAMGHAALTDKPKQYVEELARLEQTRQSKPIR